MKTDVKMNVHIISAVIQAVIRHNRGLCCELGSSKV